MEIPSGILCKAIAKERVIPRLVLEVVDRKVAIPSGMLCAMMASIETIPIRYSFPSCCSGR